MLVKKYYDGEQIHRIISEEVKDYDTIMKILKRFADEPSALGTNLAEVGTDTISRQAAIDEIEYELEMINSALDSITLDFNARERLRQRRGEAKEILNSIQQLPSAQPQTARWIDDGSELGCQCSECCKSLDEYIHATECMTLIEIPKFCPNCGARMVKE